MGCTANYSNDEPVWLNTTVGESLGGNCHHLYDFASAATQQEVFAHGRNLSGGVPTWFTEICCEYHDARIFVQLTSSGIRLQCGELR